MDSITVALPAVPAEPNRNVGMLLGVGIFFLPFVFVWFLLRQGHTTLAKALGFGWFAFCLFATVLNPTPGQSSAMSASASAGATEPARQAEMAMTVTADQLFDAYDANEVAADREYKGKKLQVHGTVHSVSSDFMDRAVVSLKTSNEFSPVRATGDKAFTRTAASLAKGSSVVLRCTGDGEIIGSPTLDDCTIGR